MKEWGALIRQHGFAAFVAVVLLAMAVGLLPSPISRTEALLTAHMEETRGVRVLLRIICQNTAPNDLVRLRCIEAG